MGMLDLVSGHDDILKNLNEREVLSDDLEALGRVVRSWKISQAIDVGESGTLYRFLQYLSWKSGAQKIFLKRGTLVERSITGDPAIVSLPQKALLLLDNGTSQWASAAALFGDEERIPNPPYKLQLTYDAIAHWSARRTQGRAWDTRSDDTITDQARYFLEYRAGERSRFAPKQAEDYCFARAFGLMNAKEGERRWPSLRFHESDRIVEMERSLELLESTGRIDAKDHRVVQSLVLLAEASAIPYHVTFPNAVNKSWPEFWGFLSYARSK